MEIYPFSDSLKHSTFCKGIQLPFTIRSFSKECTNNILFEMCPHFYEDRRSLGHF